MKYITLEDAENLLHYTEAYLTLKFYYISTLIPQIGKELVAQLINWPLEVLQAFLDDNTPEARKLHFDHNNVSITKYKQAYMDTFLSMCARYYMFPKPKSQLEASFIEAVAQHDIFKLPENDFQVLPFSGDILCPLNVEQLWNDRTEIYKEYGIDPKQASILEHDFVQAIMIEKQQNVKLRFEYVVPKESKNKGQD